MYQKITDKIKNSAFARDSLTLLSGSLLAQLIPLAIMPLLTRLFNEDMFGIYFIYSSILIILSILVTLKFELAIVLPKRDEDAVNLLAVSIITSTLMSIIIFIGIYFLSDFIIQLLGDKKIGGWLYLIPLSVFFLGIFQSLNYWHIRKKTYKEIAYAKIIRATTAGSIQSGGGFTSFSQWGLIPGMIVGQLVSALYLVYKSLTGLKDLLQEISLRQMIFLARSHINIPLFNTLIGLLNKISNQLPILLLTRFFGLSAAAYYGLASRVINAPSGLIGQAVGQVFYQKSVEIYNSKSGLLNFVKQTYKKLFLVALPLFTALTILSFFFGFIFGNEWGRSGMYGLLLLPWLFIAFLNSPITYIITILNKQRQIVIYDIFLLISRFVSLYTGYACFNNVYYSIFFFSATGLIFNSALAVYLLHISKQEEWHPGTQNG